MKRPLAVFGIPFLIVVYSLSYLSPIIVMPFAFVGAVLNFLRYKNTTMLIIIIVSIVFAFNITTTYHKDNIFDTSVFHKAEGNITAKVLDKATTSSNSIGYTIEVLSSDIENLPIGFKGILYSDFSIFVDYYDTIDIKVTCNHITDIEGFSLSSYYQSNGILMQFFSYNTPIVIAHDNENLLYKLKYLKEDLATILDKRFNTEYSGMIKAMLLGDDSDLDELLYFNAGRAGLSHIFVVSGLHLGLLVLTLVKLCKALNIPTIVRYPILIAITWLLVFITGMGIPTVRAGIMMTIYLIGELFYRQSDGLNSLAGAGVVIVLLNPLVITSISFQLSFMSVLGIIVFSEPISTILERYCARLWALDTIERASLRIFVFSIIEAIVTTLSATLGMFPVVLFAFKGISLVALLSNLIVLPLMPPLLVVGILLLITTPMPPLAGVFASITLILLYCIKTLTNVFASFPFAYLGLDYPITFLYLIFFIIIFNIFINITGYFRKWVLICATFFTALSVFSTYVANMDILTLTIFASSDGTSILLSNNSTGNIINIKDNDRNDINIASYLQAKNITSIDNYVNFNQSNVILDDLVYLKATTPIAKIINSKDDILNEYITFNDSKIIASDNYKIYNNGDNYLDIYYGEHTYILGELSGLTILITNSPEVANTISYDILFIDSTTSSYSTADNIISNSNQQVIILNESKTRNDTQRKTIAFKL